MDSNNGEEGFLFLNKCGEHLGSGGCRDVYAHKNDPLLVVKVQKEKPSHKDQNLIEFKNWQNLRDIKEMADWLAPCIEISSCGKYLIQARGKSLPPVPPKGLPDWLKRGTDYQWSEHSQWVDIDGITKMCDYGMKLFDIPKKI